MKLSSYSNRSRAYDRYYFRCSRCMAVLSIAVAAVDGAAFGLGLIGLVVKRIMGKDLKVESVGSNQNLQHLVGAHYPLEVLQKWASR